VQELRTGQGQILQCTGAENWTKVRYYSAGAGNWTRSDITVYRSWELDKVRYYSVQELGTGQRSDITVYRR
jgi:hypothetical protein